MRSVLLSILLLVSVSGVSANPLLVDQSCVNSSCFAGDSPGYPIEITQPGSYRLTSNLFMGNQVQFAIIVLASNVHIDMDGFSITGNNYCEWTGESTECKLSPTGGAILTSNKADSVSVVNGSIRGIAGSGILMNGVGARVHGVIVQHVSGDGMSIEGSGIVTESVVDLAAGRGLFAQTGSLPVLFSRSVVSRSTQAFNAGTLDNIVAKDNGQGIGGLPTVIDGSRDEFSLVLP